MTWQDFILRSARISDSVLDLDKRRARLVLQQAMTFNEMRSDREGEDQAGPSSPGELSGRILPVR